MRKPGFLKPCPAVQAFSSVAKGDNSGTDEFVPLEISYLPCEMAQGHEGSHMTTTPDGKPYAFPNFY